MTTILINQVPSDYNYTDKKIVLLLLQEVNYVRFTVKWGEAPIEKSTGLYGEQVRTITETPKPKYITCNGITKTVRYGLEPQFITFNVLFNDTVEFEVTGDYVEDLILYEITTGVDLEKGRIFTFDTLNIELTTTEPVINPEPIYT